MTRFAARVDDNQGEIVKFLRSIGVSVQILSGVGHGCPDLLIGVPGANDLWELKDGKKVASARKLTTHEFEWHQRWRGPVCIVRSIEEAEERLKWIRERALKNE